MNNKIINIVYIVLGTSLLGYLFKVIEKEKKKKEREKIKKKIIKEIKYFIIFIIFIIFLVFFIFISFGIYIKNGTNKNYYYNKGLESIIKEQNLYKDKYKKGDNINYVILNEKGNGNLVNNIYNSISQIYYKNKIDKSIEKTENLLNLDNNVGSGNKIFNFGVKSGKLGEPISLYFINDTVIENNLNKNLEDINVVNNIFGKGEYFLEKVSFINGTHFYGNKDYSTKHRYYIKTDKIYIFTNITNADNFYKTIIHEIGHSIHFKMQKDKFKKFLNLSWERIGDNPYNNEYKIKENQKNCFVSDYSRTNYMEDFAETFKNYVLIKKGNKKFKDLNIDYNKNCLKKKFKIMENNFFS